MQKPDSHTYSNIIDYIPAKLYEGKEWFVAYRVVNPATGKLHRKKIKVNRVKGITARRQFARGIIHKVNVKLATGWNPYIEQEAPKAFAKLADALQTFVQTKIREKLSPDSIRVYKSTAKILTDYISTVLKSKDLPVISFSSTHAKNYLEYLYANKNISNYTFNNYKSLNTVIWNWFKEHQYVKANPFESIKKKRVGKKKRTIIDAETRTKIKSHLINRNEKEYLTIIMLCFHGLMRPKEICLLKPANIILEKQMIFLTPDMTKDKDERIVSLTPELVKLLKSLNLSEIPKEYYIFSTSFRPGKIKKGSREVGKRWANLRKEIGMPMEYQFYSLKDSGIVQKFKDGVNPLDIRDQAGHSSLEQTNAYAKYANLGGSDDLRNKASDF